MNITLLSSAHTNNPTLVDVGNVTQYTLQMDVGTTFQLTVRAYQDLLGPESKPITITGATITNGKLYFKLKYFDFFIYHMHIYSFSVVFLPLQWSLLSNRTSPEVKYRVYCKTINTKPDHIVWRKNGIDVVNSSSTTMSHQLLDATIDNYTNTLTVTGDHRTQTISCIVNSGTNEYITIEG